MDVQKICLNCMRTEIPSQGICRLCGFAPAQYKSPEGVLPPWTILNGRYLVGTLDQCDASSITYHGYDLVLDVPVSLREFFLSSAMRRGANGLDVVYDASQQSLFFSSRERFSQMGMLLCRQERQPGLQAASNCFRENHTWYVVGDALRGISLPAYISRNPGVVTADTLQKELVPMMRSLAALNRVGIMPCDVRADHVMVDETGAWTLFNFTTPYTGDQGFNRFVTYPGNMAEQSGYSWGPASDVYGMGILLQSVLHASSTRIPGAEMAAARAVQPNPAARYASLETFADALSQGLRSSGPASQPIEAVPPAVPAPPQKQDSDKKKRGWLLPLIICLIVLAALVSALLIWRPWQEKDNTEEQGNTGTSTQSTEKQTETSASAQEQDDEKQTETSASAQNQNSEKETDAQTASSSTQNQGGEKETEADSAQTQSSEAQTTAQEDLPDDSVLMSDEGVPEQTNVTHTVNGQDVQSHYAKGDAYDDGGTTTVMVYIIGSNLESSSGLGSEELKEIRDSGVDLSKVNIMVCTGGATEWAFEDVEIPGDRNCYLHLESGGYSLVSQSSENRSMVDAQTLADFIDYSYDNYPADHYSLILWDHGGGPVYGYGVDDWYDGTLFLKDMKDAMDRTRFAKEERFDWMGFDACLMSSIEVADVWSDYADYIVLSQDVEPGYGWRYSFLETLNTTTNPVKVSEAIIDRYMDSYDDYVEDRYHPIHTISCLDLSCEKAAMNALDSVFQIMETDMDNSYAKQARIRDEVKRYALQATAGKRDGYDLIDLYDFAERISVLYPQEGAALVESLQQLVVYRRSNIGDVDGGVSFYYPYDCEYVYDIADEQGIIEDINPSEAYVRYIRRMWDNYLKKTSGADWSMKDIKPGSGEVVLQLSQEQLGELSSAYFTILEDNHDGTYTPVLSECVTWPDEDGVLHASSSQDLVYIKNSDGETKQAVPIRQIEKTAAYDYFLTLSVKVLPAVASMIGLPSPNISVNYHQQAGSSDATIETVTPGFSYTDPDYESGGRSEISFASITELSYTLSRFTPTTGSDGNMLPCLEWKEEEEGRTGKINIDLELGIEKKSCEEVGGDYVCQFTVQDVYGEVHGSELSDLP